MALFIGGPLDGQLIEVERNREQVQIAIEKPLTNTVVPEQIKSLTDIFYYKREILSCPTAEYAIFVPRSFSCETVMETLIDGYHNSIHGEES